MIDSKGSGYITLECMFMFLEEELNSVISPYLSHFFQLIDKEVDDRISFVEWLPSLSVYCLYSVD
jgi:hypothetical protein